MAMFPTAESRHAATVIASLSVYEFCHWFDPSTSYLARILHEHGMPFERVYRGVFPWATYGLMPMTLLAAGVFELRGFRTALCFAALANLASVLLIMAHVYLDGPEYLVYVSELCWAYSFSAFFVVNAAVYRLLRVTHFGVATSVTRTAALVATVLASATGFLLASHLRHTLLVAAAAKVVGVVWLLAVQCAGWLHPLPAHLQDPVKQQATGSWAVLDAAAAEQEEGSPTPPSEVFGLVVVPRDGTRQAAAWTTPLPQHARYLDAAQEQDLAQPLTPALGSEEDAHTRVLLPRTPISPSSSESRGTGTWTHAVCACTAYLRIYGSPRVALWSAWYSILLGVHTLVATYDQSLYAAIDKGSTANGAIKAVAYLVAAAGTLLGPRALRCALDSVPVLVLALSSACSAALLVAMGSAATVLAAGGSFILYHAVAEFVLVIGRTQVGQAMVAVEELRTIEEEEAAYAAAAAVAAAPSQHASEASSPLATPSSSGAVALAPELRARFALVLGTNTFLGFVAGAAVHAAASSGIARGVRGEFLAYAVAVGVVTLLGGTAVMGMRLRRVRLAT